MSEVLAAGGWKTNAEMIADVAEVGWLDGRVLDLTYGLGKFWTEFHPEELVANDYDLEKGDEHYDARRPPHVWWGQFDAVVFDPPYKTTGTSQLGDEDAKYGVDVKRSHAEQFSLIIDGSVGASRCVRPGGWMHVKCQAQILGGKYIDQPRLVADAVLECAEFELRSVWHFVGSIRPQPSGRRQVNPRNNVSQLLSFHRKKTKAKQVEQLFDVAT